MKSAQPRGGFFLVLVLIVIVVATMAVYSFTGLMLAYDESAYLAGDLVQARVAVAEGADDAAQLVHRACSLLDRAGSRNAIPGKRVARLKSRLAAQLHRAKKA